MKITKYFLIIAFLCSALVISYAFWEKDLWFWIGLSLILLILWWVSQSSEINAMPSIFFVGYIGICMAGFFWGLKPLPLFLGVMAALNIWDSDRFRRRWKDTQMHQSMRNLERKHLLRILAVDGTAILLATIGLSFQTQLNFVVILIVGFLAVISLSRLIILLRDQSQKP